MNEDTLTVQIMDSHERLLSLTKGGPERVFHREGIRMMPSFREKLSEAERADLIAYLVSLKGQDGPAGGTGRGRGGRGQ